MLRVERQGPIVRLVYEGGEREAMAIGPLSDLPTVLDLFVAQMRLRRGRFYISTTFT
jgi:hypothetical protein